MAVPHAHLRRLRGDAARHAGAEGDAAAQGAARRSLVLLRPDRAAVRLRRGGADHARDRGRRRLRDQRPEGVHLRHGHQRLLPAGDAHQSAGGKKQRRHHQFPGRHQAAGHRGAQDQDARPARHRHHAGVLQRRQGAGLGRARRRSTTAGRRSMPISGTSGCACRRRAPARPRRRSTTRSTTPRRASSSASRSASSRRSRTSSPT